MVVVNLTCNHLYHRPDPLIARLTAVVIIEKRKQPVLTRDEHADMQTSLLILVLFYFCLEEITQHNCILDSTFWF